MITLKFADTGHHTELVLKDEDDCVSQLTGQLASYY